MDKFDRIQHLDRILRNRKTPISLRDLAQRLECSEKTAKRAIDTLRNYCNAPVYYDSKAKGWAYSKNEKFELPGIWLTAEEIQGFAAMFQLFSAMEAEALSTNLKPVKEQIEKLLKSRGLNENIFRDKVKYRPTNKQSHDFLTLSKIADALQQNYQLTIEYLDYKEQKTKRNISPQTLVYYTENWYVDAWCHYRQDLRSFMLPRIESVTRTKQKAKKISQKELNEYFLSSYGIFSGKPRRTAKLRVFPEKAREAASRQWHPDQAAHWENDCLMLEIPYNEDTELLRDILKYGNDIEVLSPSRLRNKVKRIIWGMMDIYQ